MKIFIEGHSFNYEIEKLCRIFLPFEKIEFIEKKVDADTLVILSREEAYNLFVSLNLDGKSAERKLSIQPCDDKEAERQLAVMLYECFVEITGYESRWGILTGVRPAKLFSKLMNDLGIEGAREYFSDKLLVSPQKSNLCLDAVKGEKAIIDLSEEKSISLYVGIPFCPSRCSYCSFVSHSVEQAKKLIPQYLELLCVEIKETGEIAKKCDLKLETVYIGGGTPTSLSAEQLETLMNAIKENFDIENIREYTVEAGRPDTITIEKLNAIKLGGATRISINPQTMNDAVLENIGRKHTADETVTAFHLAREAGFDNINMDLIAGLPGDTYESFCETIKKIKELDPESVTIHTLSLKRSSTMNVNGEYPQLKIGEEASKMLDFGKEELEKSNLYPYYMYRQSKMVGNLENVGYSKPGFEGLYNVYIMDETHTILACGASAVTKLRKFGYNYIERVYNFKYPYEYINRFQEQLERKEKILKFYDKQDN